MIVNNGIAQMKLKKNSEVNVFFIVSLLFNIIINLVPISVPANNK